MTKTEALRIVGKAETLRAKLTDLLLLVAELEEAAEDAELNRATMATVAAALGHISQAAGLLDHFSRREPELRRALEG